MQLSTRIGLTGMFFVASIVGLGLTSGVARAQDASPVGYWKTIDDETNKPKSIVQIVERGGKLYGTIVKLIREPEEDQNPVCDKCEGDKKGKPAIGLQILEDLTQDDEEWSGGTVLDPDNGKTYKCYIEVIEGGSKLKVRGYIGFSLLGRTQYWLRTAAPDAQ